MDDFKVENDRQRRTSTKIMAVVFGIILILFSIYTGIIIGYIIGPLLIWSAFFTKYTIVSKGGIVVHYDAKLFKYKEEWLFKEITNLHKETAKDPNYVILHFTKGVMSKRLVFNKKDGRSIIDLALNENSEIHYGETA